jgi:hypothetical protein
VLGLAGAEPRSFSKRGEENCGMELGYHVILVKNWSSAPAAKQRNAQLFPRDSRPPLAREERTLSDQIEVVDFVSARPGDATFGGPAGGWNGLRRRRTKANVEQAL